MIFRVGDEVEVTKDHIFVDYPAWKKGDRFTIGHLSDVGAYNQADPDGWGGALVKYLKLVKSASKAETQGDTMPKETKTLRKIRIINKDNDKELVKDEAITTATEENFIRNMILKHGAKLKGKDIEGLHIHAYEITSYTVDTDK